MNSVAIFGGRGAGELVADYLRSSRENPAEVVGFLNDAEPQGAMIGGVPVIGPFAHWRSLPEHVRFLAPLHRAKENRQRAALIEGLGVPEDRWARALDRHALVRSSATLGVGCTVGAFAEVSVSSRLGRHVEVRKGAYVGHDSVVDDHAFIGTHAVLCGFVRVGPGAHVAPQSVVRERVTIGAFAVIGFGSVVVKDVPDNAIVAARPAQIIGRLPENEGA